MLDRGSAALCLQMATAGCSFVRAKDYISISCQILSAASGDDGHFSLRGAALLIWHFSSFVSGQTTAFSIHLIPSLNSLVSVSELTSIF